MDMKTLVVGQEVYVYPGEGCFGYAKGKVAKIVPPGVDVQLDEPIAGESLIRFDYDGTEMLADRHKWNLAPEQYPWTLDDMPFEERTAKIEHHQRLLRIIKTLVIHQELWMVSGPYIKGECFIKGKVIKLSSFVEVVDLPWGDRKGGELRRFCFDGTQYDGKHHPEFGPWRLDDMPFAGRTAFLERWHTTK